MQTFALDGYTQNSKISLSVKDVKLENILLQIENESYYRFAYNKEEVNVDKTYSVEVKNANIEDVLTHLFGKQQNVRYRILNGRQIVLSSSSSSSPKSKIMQQQQNISGKVTDSSGAPLPGVTVVIKGTTTGTVTDNKGNYSITGIPSNATLLFSFVGMKSQENFVAGKTTLNIRLSEESIGIDEVVAVGYGTQKKVNLTGSVQNVTSDDLVKRSVSNASNALQGLIPGVSVVQSSGEPGADGASIRIRGTGSLNSHSNPLVLVDGVEESMDYVDLNSIESISVLKDAASASIYGSRASNGVILITTKRAQKDDLKISYNGYAGFNTPTEMPEQVSAVGYMEAINTARSNSDMDPQYSESLINQYKTDGADNFYRYDTDWQKEVIKDFALTHNNSISVSGGSEDIKIFGNAGYYYQDGQIANNNYDRMTLRLNTDVRLTDWMKIGADVNILQSETKRPSLTGTKAIIREATTFVPVFSGINDDGTWGYGQNGDNPIAIAEDSGLRNTKSPELGLKGFLTLNPTKDIEIFSSYSSKRNETRSDYFIKPYDTYESGVYKISYPADGTTKYEGWSQLITNQFNLQGSYEKKIQNNYFKVLVGFQTEEKKAQSFATGRKGYEFNGFEDISHGDVATATNSGSHWAWAMRSFYGRINYNLKGRYLLELNGRMDASSRFMADCRNGFFPSASIGWRISEENFFEPIKNIINNLKIRGSYGILGNQDIYSYYPYAATVSPGTDYWFDEELASGVAQTQVSNKKISWEKSKQMNFGIDADLWDSKLNVSFDYYIKNINDMLQQFPIPLYVGFSSPWENAGSMRNNGWDFIFTWRNKIGNVNYHITGTLSDVKNTVTNLYGKEYIGTTITREGDPLSSWYGYVSDGYFQTQEEIDASPVYGARGNVKPGYIKYKDLSGPEGTPDGVINNFDRTILGNSMPRYEYSANLGAEWKGFDFTLFLQGVGKKEIYYSGRGARPFYIGGTIYKNQLNSWTENNRNAKFPLLLIDGTGNNQNNINSDFWVKSGAYMRIKNLVVGYSLPRSVLSRINIEKFRIYMSGQNLFTLSKAYKGYDPEISVGSGAFYPVMRTYTIGMDINF